MKKEWKQPKLEILEVSNTMMGPNDMKIDATFQDQDEIGHLHGS